MTNEEFGKKLVDYSNKYKIPTEYVFNILEDQKVVPMIRGKATEFNVYIQLKKLLNHFEWSVQKLNLNAQVGSDDEDISITHRRSGIIIKVESKNAVRGSFKSGIRCRKVKEPHCTIKCHRSRSNIELAGTSNDRYSITSFDIVITNLSNAIIAGATYTDSFELIENKTGIIDILAMHYKVSNNFDAIFEKTFSDWRFAKSQDLAEAGFIPRTPTLLLKGGDAWQSIENIESALKEIVQEKIKAGKRR